MLVVLAKGMRVEIWISGDVIGVFFRAGVRDLARSLGLTGMVENSGDKVHVIAEGEKKAIDQLITFCKQGPEGAKVENVDVTQQPETGEFQEFA
ncbi:MAG: acylphosphatase [Candidatus Woesearchaeota archaeon]|jgi:acylphosphatase|nr:acylphosphatase [Candidatus Woesearchaeota archaeon]MDP7467602.1 acylphosphatase [Candidatus Woesearchaeota archaeon]